jgi:predicted thioesterase
MKDYAAIITHSKRAIYQQIINRGSSKKHFTEWNALTAIEHSAMVLKDRVDELLLPDGYEDVIKEVKIDLLKPEAIGEKVLVKAQLFTINKKEHQLRVFAHQLKSNGKSSKLAKAVYSMEIVKRKAA